MVGRTFVSFVCVAISASFLHYGPHMASAHNTPEHNAVEKMMCADLPSVCPCNANKLQVIASNALVCGASQTRASMLALPTIKPPIGVTLNQSALYTVMIIDRDAPKRQSPNMRYWLHGLFADITASDLSEGDIANGTVLMSYAGPTPPQDTGAHSYQVLLLKQDPTVGASDMQDAPITNRGQFKAQAFLTTNKMCGHGQLIGTFEFHCSNPEGADPNNPDRQCPDPLAAVPHTTAASDGETTEGSTSGSSKGFGPCDILPALGAVILFRVLLL